MHRLSMTVLEIIDLGMGSDDGKGEYILGKTWPYPEHLQTYELFFPEAAEQSPST